jgi:serine/threonine protein kinase
LESGGEEVTLATGTRLGPYEVLSAIGAGGMGEVYRARDTRLNRDVALKVLPEIFSRDVQRMARFEREAKLLASLNHPNIAAIYGLEESGSTRALVMELVEGPTLAERIRSGSIPLDEALPIARQVADAVEYAHDNSVIHRDLKPANIKVKADGTVKVLDFGLAKAMSDDPAEGDMSNSPTLSMAATMQGVILGTAAYMSPEQAKGKSVDRRTDVWAFGAVLYELLTGKPAFPGEDITEVLASVVKSEPDWDALPTCTPSAIRTLLRRCLDKNLRHRLPHIADARITIEDVLSGVGPVAAVIAGPDKSRERLPWVAAALLLISTAALAVWVVVLRRQSVELQAIEFSVHPPGDGLFYAAANVVTVSPDGSKLALIASDSPSKPLQLWIRSLDSEVAQPLSGTENPSQPFWSPDSRFVAFYADGKLKKVAVTGGPVQTLTDTGGIRHGTWSREDVILYAPGDVTPAVIYRVSAAGGEATPVTELDASREEITHSWPYFLPDGDHFLYLAVAADSESDAVFVGSLSSAERKLLLNASSNVVYVPAGYLVFNREGTLMAQPFDASHLEMKGEAVPIAEDVQFNAANGRTAFTASENGVLAYRAGASAARTQLAWFDRSGKQISVLGDPAGYADVELSPDEKRVSVSVLDPGRGTRDIWIYDVARGLRTRFTFDTANELGSAWSPDNSRLVFTSARNGAHDDLYQKASNGSGTEEAVLEDNLTKLYLSWSPDGGSILYGTSTGTPQTGNDLWVLPLSGDRKPVPFLQTQFWERLGQFSPDGRWVAYASNESGRFEIYVAPFPGPGGKWQVSVAGGQQPRWRGDGSEVFYLAPGGTLMAAKASSQRESFQVGEVRPLFQAPVVRGRFQYDVTGDGQQFLMNTTAEQVVSTPVTVVVNWIAKLKK